MTRAVGQNLLPNTNWQLTSKLKAERSRTTAMKADGTEFQAQIDIQGFSTLNNQPTFYSNIPRIPLSAPFPTRFTRALWPHNRFRGGYT